MAGITAAEKAERERGERAKMRAEHPDSWIALEPGDTLTGRVTDVQEAWSDVRQQGSFYPLVSVAVDDATGYDVPDGGRELKIHAFGAVLYNEFMRRQPEIGETITVTFDGEREPRQRGMNPTKVYSLRVHGRTDEAKRAYGAISKAQPASTVGRPQAGQVQPPAEADPPPEEAAADNHDDIPF